MAVDRGQHGPASHGPLQGHSLLMPLFKDTVTTDLIVVPEACTSPGPTLKGRACPCGQLVLSNWAQPPKGGHDNSQTAEQAANINHPTACAGLLQAHTGGAAGGQQ